MDLSVGSKTSSKVGGPAHSESLMAAAAGWQGHGGAGEHTAGQDETYEYPPIKLVREVEGSIKYGHSNGHHARKPDLSANISGDPGPRETIQGSV